MTDIQRILLARLSLEFNVDISPADALEGANLDAWIDQVERDLLTSLQEQHKS